MENNALRKSQITRNTNETEISLSLNIDGTGECHINSGLGFLDHMLTLMTFWAGFDLTLTCQGDTHIDSHHSIEDIGLALGDALRQAIIQNNNGNGIERIGFCRVPMDEALADVSLDISGRSWLEWRNDELLPPMIAGDEKDVWREFYKSFAAAAKMNIHINFLYGKNGHHLLESVAKSFGKSLKTATRITGKVPTSTKGCIDI